MNLTVDQLADKVNGWCVKRRLVPANGQAATEMSVRTLRYYRTLGLLDAPSEGGGTGFGQHHFLQATAVRVLQAQGLPLTRIQSLLFARSDAELQAVLDSAGESAAALTETPQFAHPETWQTWPLSADVMLISRRAGLTLSAAQLQAVQAILDGKQPSPTTQHKRSHEK